jgi:glycosyltransferase involved in cell wall biosynthesis
MIQKASHKFAQVSVIIPCYSCSDTLVRAVTSVASQIFLPMEIILIEDASPDHGKTLLVIDAVIKQYSDILNIKLIKFNENKGAASARNAGWNLATQPFIAFLDADDEWHRDKLKIQFEFMKSNQEISISGHSHQIKSSFCESWESSKKFHFKLVSKWSFLLKNQFCTPSVMLKREIPFRFLEEKRYAEDYLLWLQISFSNQ